MGTAQVLKGDKNLNNSSFNNARSWHDEAYLYINQAITQVSADQAGHCADVQLVFITSGEAEHRQEGCGSDDVSEGPRNT